MRAFHTYTLLLQMFRTLNETGLMARLMSDMSSITLSQELESTMLDFVPQHSFDEYEESISHLTALIHKQFTYERLKLAEELG